MNVRPFLRTSALIAVSVFAGLLPVAKSYAQTGGSELVTWTCTSSPCPWGPTDIGQTLVWPASAGATTARLGYTTSKDAYLPGAAANGTVIEILSGSATAYAGTPSASSHYALTSISAGGIYTVSGLAADEVLSVQSGSSFTYRITFPQPDTQPDPEQGGQSGPVSQLITWSCTGTPCPWGPSDSGHALVWPDDVGATHERLGYTTSEAIYLPNTAAHGATINIKSGTATVYAGLPGASSHTALATISAGGSYQLNALAAGEVFSVQAGSAFTYALTLPQPQQQPDPTYPDDLPPGEGPLSQLVTWSCSSSPCPWGPTDISHALVWPADAGAISNRLGYTTSSPIYLPVSIANGSVIWINGGVASVYLGTPDAPSHQLIATINAGEFYVVPELYEGQVLSVQSPSAFRYEIALPDEEPQTPPEGDVVSSIPAFWRCTTPGCTSPDWVAAVINWPSWSAYSTNNRSGDQARQVYSASGELLTPYMGSWAHGCEVTAVTGVVLIVEWQRGTDVWRETWLTPGDTHTIALTAPEDGALIETYDYGPAFSVTLNNCTPQQLP